MASKASIMLAINLAVKGAYSAWQVGITNYPHTRRAFWEKTNDVSAWRVWEADSLEDAQAIEAYFIHDKKMKGMTGGGTGDDTGVYVYIF